jgi:hypothetical protein
MSVPVTLLMLPHDTLRRSLSCLNVKELASLALVNKYFHQLSDEIVKDIVEEIRKTLFPKSLSRSGKFQIPYANMKRLLHRLTSTQVYTIGGAFNSDQVNVYLPQSGAWHMSADMIRERERSGVAVVRGYIVALSGESDDSTANAEIYSPLENVWSSLPSLPMKIRGMACIAYDDQVIAIGGQDVDGNSVVSSAQVLDFKFSSSSSSQEIKNGIRWVSNEEVLLESRYAHSAVVYEDEVWVAGGTTANDAYSTSVETLSYKNGSFKSGSFMPSMVKGRRHFQLVVCKGKLYAIGGDDEATIECFDSVDNEWKIVTSFPTYKTNFSATSDGENIYIFGGQNKRRAFLSSWECYNVVSERWTVTKAHMPSHESIGFSHGSAVTMNFQDLSW